ncbi:hypothetical protein ACQP1P_27280 [Dactylosporangium sp. CA-052675]|uniref:hypothetical protein n=1 Tax=Dactylosporangium sp. CA-052675 TaxID=3239927 RepID=UPI003D8B6766
MILRALGLGPVRTDPVAHYPDLAPLRRAVRAGDWGGVAAYFAALAPRADHSVALRLVAASPGAERFLQAAVDAERDAALPRTLLGARFIVIGWAARTGARAKYVTPAQWRVFHDYIGRAERLLADATAIDPTDAAAWTERIITARALSLGVDEARRRYERAAEHCDTPYRAQVQLVQNLCPKWGGTFAQVEAFAEQCRRDGAPGSLGGAVVADAHIEHALAGETLSAMHRYLSQSGPRRALESAAEHTVLHPDFRPVHGWVTAHSTFAFALYYGGHLGSASEHFAALGDRISPYGWELVAPRWKPIVRAARRAMPRPGR